jgi:predicted transcriptional regulator
MNKEKDQVIEMIRLLPDDSTIDDIMEVLYFRMQVDRGLKELDEGTSIPHQHVRDRLSKWLEK